MILRNTGRCISVWSHTLSLLNINSRLVQLSQISNGNADAERKTHMYVRAFPPNSTVFLLPFDVFCTEVFSDLQKTQWLSSCHFGFRLWISPIIQRMVSNKVEDSWWFPLSFNTWKWKPPLSTFLRCLLKASVCYCSIFLFVVSHPSITWLTNVDGTMQPAVSFFRIYTHQWCHCCAVTATKSDHVYASIHWRETIFQLAV